MFQSFQWPAYSAAISTMIPKQHHGRANEMLSLADTASNIFAPILAGTLLGIIGVPGILLIDLGTFIFAISALLFVHIPQPKMTEEGRQARGNILKEAVFGFQYILTRPSLLALQLVFLTADFFVGLPNTFQAAMILANTSSNEKALAAVNSVGSIGGVVGGLVMSAWGGPISDKLLEPAMRNSHSWLATSFGWAIGTGPGRGMALLFIVGGGLAALIAISGYAFKVLREADILIPDHDEIPSPIDPNERLTQMQELLDAKNHWSTQPETPERELALRAIANSLCKLGQEEH